MKAIVLILALLFLPLFHFAQFTEKQKLVATDGAGEDFYGVKLAFSGDGSTLIIGARYDNIDGIKDCGSAYVYVRRENKWIFQAKLSASIKEKNAFFGKSMALSGNGSIALIGATEAVYYFKRTNHTWTEITKLELPGASTTAGFGSGIDLSWNGKIALIGALYNNHGTVTMFTRSDDTWTEGQTFTSDDGSSSGFGCDVSISDDGSTAIVGAIYEGAAYIFTRGGKKWTQTAKLLPAESDHVTQWASDVDLSADGNTGLVNDAYTYLSGPSVFRKNGNSWVREARLLLNDPPWGDIFSAAISGDGNTVVFADYYRTIGNNEGQGMVFVFKKKRTGWIESQRLTYSKGERDDNLGFAVAISCDGKTIAAGAVENELFSAGGHGYAVIFEKTDAAFTQKVDNSKKETTITKSFLYPNPAKNIVTVNYTAPKIGKYIFEITGISGNVVLRKEANAILGANHLTLDISRFFKGIYFINIIKPDMAREKIQLSKE